MKTTHTPGPWTLANSRVYLGPFDLIGIGLPDRTEPGNWENDSRLIAAAPELLEALETLLDCSPCQNGCDPSDMTCASNLARAAIAKAKGQ